MNKKVITIVIFVLLIFAVIVSVTGIVGKYMGKTSEMMLLGLTAMVLLVMLLIEKNKKD